MTLGEAQAEAAKRWKVHGGWARFDEHAWAPWRRCMVGVFVSFPGGVTRRCLGMGKTFDQAFRAAEKKILRDVEKRIVKRKPKAVGLPTVELFPPEEVKR